MKQALTAIAVMVTFTLVALPAFASPISVVAKPINIAPGGTTEIIICEGGVGCNYPVIVSSLTVTAPDLTVYTYTPSIPQINSGEVRIEFGPTAPNAADWDDGGGGGADTNQNGDYIVAANGTEGGSAFSVVTDFIVPEFALPAIIVPSIAFGYLAIRNKLRRK